MSKNIRQKITHAIQTTFRSSSSSSSSSQDKQSSLKSKISTCCSVTKPKDYEYIPYESKQSSTKSDYVDLSECHSWSLSSSRDSGISYHTNTSSVSSSNQNLHQLQSTRTHSDDSCSLSTLSDLSYIPHDEINISKFDVTAWHSIPTSYECCHCYCHHHVNNDHLRNDVNNFLYVPEQSRHKRTKIEMFPFIF